LTAIERFCVSLSRDFTRPPWQCDNVVLGPLITVGEISSLDMALRFFRQVSFGERDPILAKDIRFYLFSLPAYIALKN
jgi:uncharacterized membrane protein (UPF0182 family)